MVCQQTLIFCIVLIITSFRIQSAISSGVFELRLKSFTNENGKDSLGQCCSGERSGRCTGPCKTRFRVCLKHYQVKIDTTSACTFGDVMTPVLGDNNVHLSDGSSALDIPGFSNPIRFPFDFAWPGTFSLIVEAWHDAMNGTNLDTSAIDNKLSPIISSGVPPGGGGRTLISRLTTQRWLDVANQWTEDEHKSSHSRMRYEYRVTCDEHYYGAGCANLCRPRDDNFGHYSCSPTGDRICLSGWKGDYCTKPRCLTGCDEQHGHCSKPEECLCHSGWKGRLCDQCERYPGCLHGTCQKPWDCLCDEGWGGLFCNQDLNYCTNHKPCRNGGTCFNTGQGSYTCSCPPGYTGTDCDRKLSDCSHKPCLNGAICKENGTNYQCECSKGWYGTHCEIAMQTCEDKPCKHGATCMDSVHGYKCSCPPGFSGPECQHTINHCQPNPCSNGGHCSSLADNSGHSCNCRSGFNGPNCHTNIDDCNGNPCLNGGTCLDMVNSYRCQCVPGYVGNLCQSEVNYCVAKPCANGGVCENFINDYKCKCKPGFAGKDCSVFVDECKNNPCNNGGTCYNRGSNGFQCDCPYGFDGATCEIENSVAGIVGNSSMRVSSVSVASASESTLSKSHWYLIAIGSALVPCLVLIAACVVNVMKRRRKKEQKRADEEARMQNEQNSVHSGMSKRGDPHMIKNTWGQCVKNVEDPAGGTDMCYPKPVYASAQNIEPTRDGSPQHQIYTLQRSRSQKQLNVDPPTILRHSVVYPNRVSCKDLSDPNTIIVRTATPAPLDNRISLLSSVNTSYSNLSDTSVTKPQRSSQLLDKEKLHHTNSTLNTSINSNSNISPNIINPANSGSNNNNINNNNNSSCTSINSNNNNNVYVIDEHYTQTLFATEV